MIVKALMATAVCALMFGCTDSSQDQSVMPSARTSSVSYVCVGMETSKRFGECPGCKLDSDRMDSLFKNKFGYNGVLLQSENATRRSVAEAINNAVLRTPEDGLFIFYYSGHGGQEKLDWGNTEPDGADSADEYLCLYDSYLLDDEIWKMISKCKGRVFMCFDACHSQTMFRTITYDIALEKGEAVPLDAAIVPSGNGFVMSPRGISLDTDGMKMLCWSGCLEAEYSYGSTNGGVMTNAILAHWKPGIGYAELWKATKAEVSVKQPGQHPVETRYGTGFNEAFR